MIIRELFAELKRRRVIRVAVVYAIAAWAFLQGINSLLPIIEAPAWVAKFVLAALVLGFPLAIALAWAFDITPDGVKRTPPAPGPAGGRAVVIGAVIVLAVASAGWLIWGRADSTAAGRRGNHTIAVLPFDNLSGDSKNDYFSVGMTEDILTQLAKLEGLDVTSRTSVMQYKGTTKTVREIARELGVTAVLEGSVRLSGERVRIVAQLIEAGTDKHLWAETYDRDFKDIFAVQSDVAQSIAEALRLQLTDAEKSQIARKPTDNPEAYQLFLQGRFAEQRGVFSEQEVAIRLFERAIALDSQFAEAYSHLAGTHLMRSIIAQRIEPASTYRPAVTAARKALELEPNLADAHAVMGALRMGYEWDWKGAAESLDRALQIDPRNETALTWKAQWLVFKERGAEGIAMLRQALAADSTSEAVRRTLGQVLALSGNTEEAIAVLERVRDLNPNVQTTQYWLMYACLAAGKLELAEAAWRQTYDGGEAVPLWEAVRASLLATRTNQPAVARATLADFQARAAKGEYIPPYAFFSLNLALGQKEAAGRALESAVRERTPILIYLRAVPRFRDFRQEPFFQAALRTVWPDDFR